MRVAVLGVMFLAGLVLAGGGLEFPHANAQPPVGQAQRAFSSPQLMALSVDAEDGRQQVVLVDPQKRVMSVYHIDRASGEIELRSVRNVHWDLLMEEFNGVSPLPNEIRSLVEQK